MTVQSGLLVKLMMLTTSPIDAEALAALRKANGILVRAKVSWAKLLDALSQDGGAPPPPPRDDEPESKHYDKREIDGMFAVLSAREINGGFAEFVEGVRIFWKQRGYLTEKQYDAIKAAVERQWT